MVGIAPDRLAPAEKAQILQTVKTLSHFEPWPPDMAARLGAKRPIDVVFYRR